MGSSCGTPHITPDRVDGGGRSRSTKHHYTRKEGSPSKGHLGTTYQYMKPTTTSYSSTALEDNDNEHEEQGGCVVRSTSSTDPIGGGNDGGSTTARGPHSRQSSNSYINLNAFAAFDAASELTRRSQFFDESHDLSAGEIAPLQSFTGSDVRRIDSSTTYDEGGCSHHPSKPELRTTSQQSQHQLDASDLPRIVGIMQSRGPLLRSEVLYLMELHALSAPYVEALNSDKNTSTIASSRVRPISGYKNNNIAGPQIHIFGIPSPREGEEVDPHHHKQHQHYNDIQWADHGLCTPTNSSLRRVLSPTRHPSSISTTTTLVQTSHPHQQSSSGDDHDPLKIVAPRRFPPTRPFEPTTCPLPPGASPVTVTPIEAMNRANNASNEDDAVVAADPSAAAHVDIYSSAPPPRRTSSIPMGCRRVLSGDPLSSSMPFIGSSLQVSTGPTDEDTESVLFSSDSSPHANDPQLQRLIAESTKTVKRNWLMQRCWATIVDRENTGLEVSFVKLLHVAGSRIVGMERFDLFANLVERRQLFMDMMTQLFQTGLDATSSVYMLHQLGARHVAYGLTRQDYEAYTGPFVRTVVACARPGTVTPLVRSLMRKFWQRATEMMLEGAAQSRGSLSLKQAPKGAPFAIVFTDIEGSTALWENQPVAMEMAVDNHHKLVRDLIHDHNGYEVKTIGDSFMIAFKGLADAVTMALRLQVELLRASVEGLVIDGARCEAGGPPEVWNPAALRVRVGVHWCTDATPKFDVVYKRYDYYGNDVNVAARVQDAACGGQVVCSASTYDALANLDLAAASKEDFTCGGLQSLDGNMSPGGSAKRPKASLASILGSSIYRSNVELSGLRDPITIYSLYPKILASRVYGERAAKRSNNGEGLYNGEGGAYDDIDNVC